MVTPPLRDPDKLALKAAEAALEFIEHHAGAAERLLLLCGPSFKVAFTARVSDAASGPRTIDAVLGTVEKQVDNIGLAVSIARDAARAAVRAIMSATELSATG
jgi:hypothetical protein